MACWTPVGGRNPEGMPAPPSPGSPSPASQVAAGTVAPEGAGLAAGWLADGDGRADEADGAAGTVGGGGGASAQVCDWLCCAIAIRPISASGLNSTPAATASTVPFTPPVI